MSLQQVVLASLSTVVVGIGALILRILLRRTFLARTRRKREAAMQRLRPHVVRFVGTPGAAPPRELMAVSNRYDRAAVARLLSRYGSLLRGEALPRIRDLLETAGYVDAEVAALGARSAWRRAAAAHTLGMYRSENATSPLLASLREDGSVMVRRAACRALGRIGAHEAAGAIRYALEYGTVPAGVAADALLRLEGGAAPELIAATDSPNLAAARAAVLLLGHAGIWVDVHARGGARDTLIRQLSTHSDQTIRAAAARSLGRLAWPQARPALLEALDDPAAEVQAEAAEALGHCGLPRDARTTAIRARERGRDQRARRAAAFATARLDPTIAHRPDPWLDYAKAVLAARSSS